MRIDCGAESFEEACEVELSGTVPKFWWLL